MRAENPNTITKIESSDHRPAQIYLILSYDTRMPCALTYRCITQRHKTKQTGGLLQLSVSWAPYTCIHTGTTVFPPLNTQYPTNIYRTPHTPLPLQPPTTTPNLTPAPTETDNHDYVDSTSARFKSRTRAILGDIPAFQAAVRVGVRVIGSGLGLGLRLVANL